MLPFTGIAARMVAACFLAMGIGGLSLIPPANAPACRGHADLQPYSMVAFAAVGQAQSAAFDSHAHLIHVIDGASGVPIPNAKVMVELKNPKDDSGLGMRQGHTNAKGLFVFTCDVRNGAARTEISAEANGFSTLYVYSFLAKEVVIKLTKEDS
jgi:hypothetical protein